MRRPSVCTGCCGPGTLVVAVCMFSRGDSVTRRLPSASSSGGAKPDSELSTSPATACLDCLTPSISARICCRRNAGSLSPTGSPAKTAETRLL